MEQILATFEVGSKGGHQKRLPEPARPRQKIDAPFGVDPAKLSRHSAEQGLRVEDVVHGP